MQEFTDALQAFSRYLKKNGRQEATAGSYVRDVQGFINFMNRHALTLNQLEPATLLSYQEYMWSKKAKINSIRRAFIGVRQFFRFLQTEKLMIGSPFEEIPLPSRDDSLNFKLEHLDILKLLSATQSVAGELKGKRDAAIICLLAFEGLKVSELISLRWQDLILGNQQASLRIPGTRARVVQVCSKGTECLSSYQQSLSMCGAAAGISSRKGYMFVGFRGRDKLVPRPKISRHGLKFLLYELGESINLPALNSEALRHFAITHQLFLGRNPNEIMDHLGLKRIGNIAKHLRASEASAKSLSS